MNNATEKQVAFLLSLIDTRMAKNGHPLKGEMTSRHGDLTAWASALSKDDASAFIERMKVLPKLPKLAVPTVDIPEGLYELHGDIVRVVHSKGTGKPYAKVVRTNGDGKQEFTYVGRSWLARDGAQASVSDLAGAPMLTLERVKALSLQIGVCAICGRELSAEQSVANSIGPVCEKKYASNSSAQRIAIANGAVVIDAKAAIPPAIGGPY